MEGKVDCDLRTELIEEKIKGVYAIIQANADIQHEVNSKMLKSLDRIETQVTKTNGRVNCLENWKWLLTGAITLLAFAIPLLIKFL